MAKVKGDSRSPFEVVCSKVDMYADVYKSNSYWQVMKRGCDYVKSEGEDVDPEPVVSALKAEQKCWGPLMSEYNSLGVVIGEIGA